MADKPTADISEIKKEVKDRIEQFSKKRASIETIISEDRHGFKELLKTNDELQEFVKELLDISKTLADENERLKEYLKNEKNAVVADYYKKKLQDSGILKR